MRFPRSSGILLHPTSLPGPFGSGDFGAAAYHFVDWLSAAGQQMWQILPLGAIGPGNSPYMSSSAFAGNPLLIDLSELNSHGWLTEDELLPHEDFNSRKVNFKLVKPYRMDRLRRAASRFFADQQHHHTEYEMFCATEREWLEDYALFMALNGKYNGQEWGQWPPALAQRDATALSEACAGLADEIGFWKFCQWSFFRQWRKLKHYANSLGVRIIGDMPIFVAYQSADVWSRQHLFELGTDNFPTVIAGVPPDYFSATGQRWGNPLFRWPAHEQENYAWWIERMRKSVEMFDIIRIDHFRGFAGYWEIPASEPTAMNGRWMPGPGEKLFSQIRQSLGKLPIIAEDLGVITPDVVALLQQFGLPGMRVMQFAFGGSSDNAYLPHNFINNMAVYVGTHDNDTTIGWFNSASDHERAFVCKYLRTDGREINWDLIHAASLSVADIAIHTMQDVLGLDGEHRMNLPGHPEGNWEWRFGWEQLAAQQSDRLYEISALHGRCDASRLII
ncbi:MAG: 4-alpha-glucanotransferase [Gallionellaceae bacterium]